MIFSQKIRDFKFAIYEILEISRPEYKYAQWSKIFDISLFVLIILNVFAVMMSTIKGIELKHRAFLHAFEVFSVIIFSIEYVLRLWTCDLDKKYPEGFGKLLSILKNKLFFIFSIWALIDLFAVLPFYLPLLFTIDLRFVRIFRLFRILRILKAGRFAKSIIVIGKVIRDTKEQLLATLGLILIIIIVSSSLIYYAECKEQPEAFSSIPASLWWGVATLTTVGYGDIYPVTALGKFCAALIAISGVGVVALPSGILASGLVEQFEKEKKGEDMDNNLTNHIVICGWNILANEIITNLLSEDIRKTGIEKIVVLVDLEEKPEDLKKFEENISFLRGDPTKKENLLKANIRECHTALVPSDLQASNPDAESLLVALTIQALDANIYVCAQVQDSANKIHFQNIKVEEIICIEDLGAGISVGSAVNHGLSAFVDELLSFNEGCEFYRIDIPNDLINKSFLEASKSFLNKNIILVGIRRHNKKNEPKLYINPQKNFLLEKDDNLFVIAESKPV
ncbi:MAG: ion transporter [Verrucomicrobiota bacterium]|nr:ion transporter [Verrucomicrobiota bacterium]